MNSKKLHGVLVGLVVFLGVVLAGSVYAANSMLVNESQQLVTLKATSIAMKQQETELTKAKRDIETYGQLNQIAQSVVPQDKDQAKTVSEITDLATQSGISRLSSIAFPPSTLGGSKQVKTSHGLTQLIPVKGMPGVYTLQITITQTATDPVPYNSFIKFLSKLEHNRRTAQVNSINVQPDAKKPDNVSFTLVIDEYIKP